MAEDLGTLATSFRTGPSFRLPEMIRALGHSPERVFAEAGVDAALYDHPDNRIAARDLGRLFACAVRTTGRADLALLVVDGFRPEGLGMIGEVAAEGPDVHTALRNLVRLLQYNTLAGYPALAVSRSWAMLKFELRNSDFEGAELILEGTTGICLRFMQGLCGRDWRPTQVHLSRRAPADPRPHALFFDAPIRFSATENAIQFPQEWLYRPVPREEKRRQAQRVNISKAPYSELARRQVAMRLGLAALDAQEIARELGLSRRQLFRHLAGEGTSFQSLVDEIRFARARHLLATGDAPLAEIAFALGFPEQSAFSRAFLRWSEGVPPREWRRAAHAGRVLVRHG